MECKKEKECAFSPVMFKYPTYYVCLTRPFNPVIKTRTCPAAKSICPDRFLTEYCRSTATAINTGG